MEWSARVEWSTPESYSVDDIDALMDQLEAYHTAIGRERVPAGATETWTAQMHVEAPSLLEGAAKACEIVQTATGCDVTGFEVLNAEVFGYRVELPCPCRRYVDDGDIDLDEKTALLSDGSRLSEGKARQLTEEMMGRVAEDRSQE